MGFTQDAVGMKTKFRVLCYPRVMVACDAITFYDLFFILLWGVLMVCAFCNYLGMVKCKISNIYHKLMCFINFCAFEAKKLLPRK